MYSVVIIAVKLKRVRWIRLTEFQDCGDKDIVNDVAKFAAEAGAFSPLPAYRSVCAASNITVISKLSLTC